MGNLHNVIETLIDNIKEKYKRDINKNSINIEKSKSNSNSIITSEE